MAITNSLINPFAFGKVVRGRNFCNRVEEIKRIKQAAESKSSLIVVSPRRYGKTSLVVNALEKCNIPFLFVDCFEVSSEREFLERVTSAYLQALRKGDILDKLKHFSKTVNLEYSFTVRGVNVKINTFHDNALRQVLGEAMKDYLLVLDEFQELFVVDPRLVKKLRSVLQFLRQGVIFLGSKKHLLFYLFSDQRSPFYNFGAIMHLDKIPEKEWLNFIWKKFKATDILISDKEVKELLQAAELIPFYVQYLCYYFWQQRKEQKSIPVEEFLEKITQSNSYIYEELYLKLPATQKKALQVLLAKGSKIFSDQTLEDFRIKSTQALHKAVTSLADKGFLDRNGSYQFNDPLFKRYLISKNS